MVCAKTLRTDDNLRAGRRFDVAKPIGVGTEDAHHDCLRHFFAILDDLQHRVAAQTRAPPDVDQQQEAVPDYPAAFPALQVHRGAEETAQRGTQSGRGHRVLN